MSGKNRLTETLVFRFCMAIAALLIFPPHHADAQLPGALAQPEGVLISEDTAEQRLAIDRKTIQTLQTLRDRLRAGNFDRAIDDFRVLRTADPLTLVPSTRTRVYIPLFRALFTESFRFPEQTRRRLAKTESVKAASSFKSDIENRGALAIPGVILSSAGTATAVEAHLIAARLHLTRGNYFAARSWLTPLMADHLPAGIRATASAILKRIPAGIPSVPDTTGPAIELPRHLVWQSRPSASPKFRKQIATFLESAHQAKVIPQSSWQDVVEGGVVFRRSFRGLIAIDQKTGDTKWEYPVDKSLDSLITSDRANTAVFGRVTTAAPERRFSTLDNSVLASTFCRDNSVGRIASDTDRLYIAASGRKSMSSTLQLRSVYSTQKVEKSSRLIAVEKKTGRRVWTLGRSTLEQKLGSSESGEWFAGPPHPSGKKLYSVFEWKGEMRLGCVTSATGELLWTSSLAFPEQSINKDRVREFWGATPTRHAGMIWCPTTTGWLVCVDELTQSVAYASQIPIKTQEQSKVRFGRNRVIALTPFASLKERWSVPRVIPVGDRIAVVSNESRDIQLMDAATGRQIQNIEISTGEVLLHADSKRLVLASPTEIRSIATSNGLGNWKHFLSVETGYPSGKAARLGTELFIPLNTGAIARCSLETGEFTETSDSVVPINSWGQLIASPELDGDFLLLSPGQASRLSAQPADSAPGSPIDIAAELMAAGKWTAALEVASTIPRSSESFTEARSVIFESQLRLGVTDPGVRTDVLTNQQLNPDQSVQVQVFDAAMTFNQGDVEEAAAKLVAILNSDQVSLRSGVPEIAGIWGISGSDSNSNSALPNTLSVQRSLAAWATMKLTELLSRLSENEIDKLQLGTLPDHSLLTIEHPEILPKLHQRMDATESLEFWCHAMAHCLHLKSDLANTNLDEEFRLASVRISAIADDVDLPLAARVLLADSLAELSPEFEKLAEQLAPKPQTRTVQDRKQLITEYQKWTANSYKMIPVNRQSAYGRMSARVGRSVLDDSVLGNYNWKVVRSSFGRLQAQGIADSASQWSIPGIFRTYGSYSTFMDLLHRQNSVVVLNTSRKMTAVSLLDQRIIWEKTGPPTTSATGAFKTTSFKVFTAAQNHLPSRLVNASISLNGSGHRWICLQSGRQLEVLDSLTGQRQWSVELDKAASQVFATDDFVIAGPVGGKETVCFDRRTGELVELQNSTSIANSAICNVGPLAVLWKAPENGESNRLEWRNLRNAEVLRIVSLEGMSEFHFMDDRTLVGVNNTGGFMTVNLVDGQARRMSFADNDLRVKRVASPGEKVDKANPDTEPPLWSADRIQIVADRTNYYISNRTGTTVASLRQPAGLAPLSFEGDLRVIDRQSGKLKWVLENDGPVIATTDHQELALLVVIQAGDQLMTQPLPSRMPVAKNQFRGISKLTGEEVFRTSIPSQHGLRYVQLDSPAPNVIDIAVVGLHVRLQGTP